MRITRRCTLMSLSAIVSQNRLNSIMQRAKINRSVQSANCLRQCMTCGILGMFRYKKSEVNIQINTKAWFPSKSSQKRLMCLRQQTANIPNWATRNLFFFFWLEFDETQASILFGYLLPTFYNEKCRMSGGSVIAMRMSYSTKTNLPITTHHYPPEDKN